MSISGDSDKFQQRGVYSTINGFPNAQLFNFNSLVASKGAGYQYGPELKAFGAEKDAVPTDVQMLNMGPMVVSGAPQFVYSSAATVVPHGTFFKAAPPQQLKMQAVGQPSSSYVHMPF